MADWQFALNEPALLIASKMVTINPQVEFITAMQDFLKLISKNKEEARKLSTKHIMPFTFTTGKEEKFGFALGKGLSSTQQIACERLC